MPGHSIVWAAFKSLCEVKPPLYRGAHFALLRWAPVCRLWSNPPPQILSPPWKLKPPRCKRDAYNQPATKFVSQGFRNSGNPGQRCISEMVSSPSAPHSPCRRRGYWSHNRAIFHNPNIASSKLPPKNFLEPSQICSWLLNENIAIHHWASTKVARLCLAEKRLWEFGMPTDQAAQTTLWPRYTDLGNKRRS